MLVTVLETLEKSLLLRMIGPKMRRSLRIKMVKIKSLGNTTLYAKGRLARMTDKIR